MSYGFAYLFRKNTTQLDADDLSYADQREPPQSYRKTHCPRCGFKCDDFVKEPLTGMFVCRDCWDGRDTKAGAKIEIAPLS